MPATTREEVRGCAGGGDPCACGLLLQMSTTLLLRWLQLGLPLQRRRGATRARGRRHHGSGRRGLGEPARNPVPLSVLAEPLLLGPACSFTRPPARAPALFLRGARALFSRFPARAPRAFPPASRAFPTRLNAFSIRSAPIKRRRAFRRAPRRAQRLIERLPPKRDAGSKFSV